MVAAPPQSFGEGDEAMRVIIVGCGRVGATLAAQLCLDGHEVCVVDREPKARRLLPANFSGQFHTGNGYSRGVLRDAGIVHADAFIAVTSGDNSNIVAARTAKEFYRVPIVIARIYDPRRADIYRDLGIPTVASVRWTVGRIYRMLAHRELTPEQTFGNGETLMVRSELPAWLAGRPLADLDVDGEVRVVEVTRGGRSLIPTGATPAEPGDLATFAVASDGLRRLRAFLDKELGT
jgi:trk system potassium uptake protein